jgi:hypothetical protein
MTHGLPASGLEAKNLFVQPDGNVRELSASLMTKRGWSLTGTSRYDL